MVKVLITGGAGFIGINAANYFLNKKNQVIILDNFSRAGAVENIKWLKKENRNSNNLEVIKGDIRFDFKKMKELAGSVDLVIHLAGQAAVTTSVLNPREDFENNTLGTINLLEAIRLSGHNPVLIYGSTNKVYGALENLKIREDKTRYRFQDLPFGVPETQNLDFHSPYGCSKGAADQYVRDYSRIYNLNTVVFRQSCIYGPRQFGIEDQGWLAWFIIAKILEKEITIYGNGKQVRDLLHVNDLVRAYDLAAKNISKTMGQVYNIGGGPDKTLSVWLELQPFLERVFQEKFKVRFQEARPGDQKIYISDIRKAKNEFAWEPLITISKGLEKLFNWILANRKIFK